MPPPNGVFKEEVEACPQMNQWPQIMVTDDTNKMHFVEFPGRKFQNFPGRGHTPSPRHTPLASRLDVFGISI